MQILKEILTVINTPCYTHDSRLLPQLIEKSPKGARTLYADGAYDGTSSREYLYQRGIKEVIPPPKKARLKEGSAFNERNIVRNYPK